MQAFEKNKKTKKNKNKTERIQIFKPLCSRKSVIRTIGSEQAWNTLIFSAGANLHAI